MTSAPPPASSTPPAPPRRWLKLAAAVGMMALGVDLFQPRSAWLRVGPRSSS